MKLRSLTRPVYLFRRIKYRLYELRHPDEPWIAQRAVSYCAQHLDPQKHVGLEWGSGRSTTWFAAHLKHLTSVEHDHDWYIRVKSRIEELGLNNVDYLYIAADQDANEPEYPYYKVTPKYVEVAQRFDNNALDFVVVDGHYREGCILNVIPKIKPGGLLLVDNTNWMAIEKWRVPASWEVVHRSTNVMTETTIWRKP